MRLSGAEAFVDCLKREGVEVVFGYPGGVVLKIYDVLYDRGIRHILVRQEHCAVHAADGYARSSGRTGVCLGTSGPGATNMITGIATAMMDSVPMVAFTGQVGTKAIGKDSFQEADITGITMPVVKHNYLVKDEKDLPRIIKEAFHIASTGRPGPVLIDIPKDVSINQFDYEPVTKIELRGYKPTTHGHPRQITQAAEAIAQAERPVLYVGGGVITAGASAELFELATRLNIPVTTTLLAKGAFPETHPLSLGMLGMHGTVYANYAVNDCDLLIAVGARFDDRVTGKVDSFSPDSKKIHIDVDPAEIGKTVSVAIPIVGDAKNVLAALNEQVEPAEHPEWLAQINHWKEKYPLRYKLQPGVVMPQYVIEELYRMTNGEAFVVTDVGQHQMWTAQYYKCGIPRQFISSGGLGTMGYGLPASIGVQVANPDKVVLCIAGDGGIQMNIQDLITAVEQKLPIKFCIINNRYLGMVRQWQQLFHGNRLSSVDLSMQPDFVKLADAYGAAGWRIDKPEDVSPAIQRALEITDRPCVLDFWVAREENVMPMVPAGGTIDQLMVD